MIYLNQHVLTLLFNKTVLIMLSQYFVYTKNSWSERKTLTQSSGIYSPPACLSNIKPQEMKLMLRLNLWSLFCFINTNLEQRGTQQGEMASQGAPVFLQRIHIQMFSADFWVPPSNQESTLHIQIWGTMLYHCSTRKSGILFYDNDIIKWCKSYSAS